MLVHERPGRWTELLEAVVEAEQAVWDDGGIAALRRRTEAMRAAVAAGCTLEEVAVRVAAQPEDVRRWTAPGW